MSRVWIPVEERDKLSRKQVAELYMAQDGRCPLCGQKLNHKGHAEFSVIPEGATVNDVIDGLEFTDEHMQPLWRGGSNGIGNRALVCRACAKGKTAKEAGERAKGIRVRDKHIGAIKKRKWPSRKFGA